MAWGGSRGGGALAGPGVGVRGTLLALTPSEAGRCPLDQSVFPGPDLHAGRAGSIWPGPPAVAPRPLPSILLFCTAPSLSFEVLPAFSSSLRGRGSSSPTGGRLGHSSEDDVGATHCPTEGSVPLRTSPHTSQTRAAPRDSSGCAGETLAVRVVARAGGTGAVGGSRLPFALSCGAAWPPCLCPAGPCRSLPEGAASHLRDFLPAVDRPALIRRLLRECRTAERSSGTWNLR